MLSEGIQAFQAGQRAKARTFFACLVELDEQDEMGWLWLCEASDDPAEREVCLENVLTINPGNTSARRSLEALRRRGSDRAIHFPISLWPLGAFWLGASLIFTGAGLSDLWRMWVEQDLLWLVVPRRGLGLLITCAFLAAGLLSVIITLQVLLRHSTGFYSSLLFSLALAAIIPICGLLKTPPDYLGGVLLALLPSSVFLLTLLNRQGFERGVGG